MNRMNDTKEQYLLTPVDGNNNEKNNFDVSFDFREFPEVIRGIEKDYNHQEDDSFDASTAFNSPLEKGEITSKILDGDYFAYYKLKDNLDFEQNGNEEKAQVSFFNISLKSDTKKDPFTRKSTLRGKKIKTSVFMKKNWKEKLMNFRDSRMKKLFWKINFSIINNINTQGCNSNSQPNGGNFYYINNQSMNQGMNQSNCFNYNYNNQHLCNQMQSKISY